MIMIKFCLQHQKIRQWETMESEMFNFKISEIKTRGRET
jgi:hypothetical protein